ncbi:magnesium transporter [Acidithiobacillus sp. CV18-2]|uniref:Magnesium transporter n=1 Tax=Igneacidithiobacillus copahuensis TaxID=2724909 RepID=A0AAE2YPT6_9PROT|nr:CorA family divalent cation transporter [Igneacidithiobacillus copahuensis]MBU2753136.1 magnesium transporter [Acidithiobacillus sp. CV18-3]MBU2756716.1 magnesium transporter [Acidithiobacillus sp. BN09-2]MBU2776601.1 magnesium transporter [Acidithiobacillus sp. CV18-2]MBU2796974.1 magnesium transporter [Acidithiobacillus sp. VAN18-2]MBU2798202.1 magnesium transporter [Acidithiobacillus sp. VAN18-4]UTV80457.1 magnesium transporter [Acidithiobacillus sp. YTS05]
MLKRVEGAFLTGNGRARDWLQLLAPSKDELEQAANGLGVPEPFLLRRLEDKPARPFVREKGFLALQLTVPHHHAPHSSTFDLLPLTILLVPGYLVTLSQEPVRFLEDVLNPAAPRKRWELVLQIIHEIARRYVRMSRDVGQELGQIEKELRRAQRVNVIYSALEVNDRLLDLDLGLLQLEHLLEELRPWLPKDSAEFLEYYEDSRIELRQAREQVDTEQETINSLLNAYTYVVNNNVNNIFKFMAALIILATIPLFIPGAAAMNVDLGPLPDSHSAFYLITGGLILVEVTTGLIFYRIGWLRLR